MDKVLDFLIFLFNYCKNVVYGQSIVWLRKFKKKWIFLLYFLNSKNLYLCPCIEQKSYSAIYLINYIHT